MVNRVQGAKDATAGERGPVVDFVGFCSCLFPKTSAINASPP